ncbi:6913_t:CDS:2 [Funneliformis caledonium]|uniref:6913_t:CDS:1 n=1 Tax=Funneliformis caledonium TaxID=1117310 RepID=A0A9N9GKF9_9GLOM|nr:6913_t:CDS:2 [Funneliformis caledonium]
MNRLIEDIFLDVNNAINMRTGEIENMDIKDQNDQRAISWSHDASPANFSARGQLDTTRRVKFNTLASIY